MIYLILVPVLLSLGFVFGAWWAAAHVKTRVVILQAYERDEEADAALAELLAHDGTKR